MGCQWTQTGRHLHWLVCMLAIKYLQLKMMVVVVFNLSLSPFDIFHQYFVVSQRSLSCVCVCVCVADSEGCELVALFRTNIGHFLLDLLPV